MGLSWQQGPLSLGAIGRFLVPALPKRLLYAEPLHRRMRVRLGGTWIADSENVIVLFEPGRYPVGYYDIDDTHRAAWSYREAYREVDRISGLVSFEPDSVSVHLDGIQLGLEPGQSVIPHGPDRNLSVSEAIPRSK
jgi:uncharacterized protein (DUF427 family)